MSNEIIHYPAPVIPYADMERMATVIAQSGLFGVKHPVQALALITIRLPVFGYEGRYEVSPEGFVWSVLTMKFLKPFLRGKYPCVCLTGHHGDERIKFVHRLVATAWIPNPNNKPQVNHLDGNKLNPSSDNLEWVTDSENKRHAFSIGLANNRSKNQITAYMKSVKLANDVWRSFTQDQIKEIRLLVAEGKTQRQVAIQFQASQSQISRIINGRTYSWIR